MCGITGFWRPGGGEADGLARDARRMAQTLVHRGPDDEGVWVDAEAGLALGFRRLAIVDLTPTGHQPMVSHDGRYVIVFNGEIFNYTDLRTELSAAGVPWRGSSDTEVILEAVSRWGFEATLSRLWGMFAIALWDCRDRVLMLARDRVGKKPVYYGRPGAAFVFGSELKALRAHASWSPSVDPAALTAYMRYGYVPAPLTIHPGILKLPPACWVRVEDGRPGPVRRYWRAEAVAAHGVRHQHALTDQEATDELDALLRDAIARRMIADVPLGAFLSGGVDSSVVVALMQAQSARPVRTFTLGFRDAAYDEAPAAATVARHLRTDHTELYVTPEEARAVIARLPDLYDEPFADSSQIPTFLVSQLARRSVTVSLSGDGGDELFGGYVRHQWGARVLGAARWMPGPARRGAARALAHIPPHAWDRMYDRVAGVLPAGLRQRHPGDKVHKLLQVLGARDADAVYRGLVSQWQAPDILVRDAREPDMWPAIDGASLHGSAGLPDEVSVGELFMLRDLLGYLPDDILTKVDRASMGTSLEARAPLLDHRIVEWAWRLPLSSRIRDGQGKWLLRQVLSRYVPVSLIERPKTGFGLPIGQWLRDPLRDWAESLLDPSALASHGCLDAAPIRAAWETHLKGTRNLDRELWTVLVFQAWHQHAMTRPARAAAHVA